MLAAVPAVVAAIATTRQPWYPVSDNAVLELRALDVFGDLPLTGAYSRYGYDHPGPAEMYLLALPVRWFGPTGMLWASALLAAMSTSASVWVAARRGGLLLAAIVCAAVVVLERSLGGELASPWNPLVPLLPFLLLVLLVWSVTCDDWWALPPAVAAASFCAQAHLAYLPFAVVLCGIAVAWCALRWWQARKRRRERVRATPDDVVDEETVSRPSWTVLVVAAAVGLVLWLPPLVDQVSGDANLTTIARHLAGGEPPQAGSFADISSGGLDQALGVVALEIGLPAPWLGADEPVSAFTGQVEGASPWRLVPVVVLFAVAAVWAWRRRSIDALKLQALTGVLAVLALVAVSRIDGGIFDYLVHWTWVIGALVVVASLWCLLADLGSSTARAATVVRWTAVAVAAVLGVASAIALRDATPPQPEMSTTMVEVLPEIEAALGDPTRGSVLVSTAADFGTVSLHGGVVAELARRGYDVRVANDARQRLVYPSRTIGEGESVANELILAPGDPGLLLATHPTARVIAEHQPLDEAERDELAALQDALADPATLAALSPSDLDRLVELRDRAATSLTVVLVPQG